MILAEAAGVPTIALSGTAALLVVVFGIALKILFNNLERSDAFSDKLTEDNDKLRKDLDQARAENSAKSVEIAVGQAQLAAIEAELERTKRERDYFHDEYRRIQRGKRQY